MQDVLGAVLDQPAEHPHGEHPQPHGLGDGLEHVAERPAVQGDGAGDRVVHRLGERRGDRAAEVAVEHEQAPVHVVDVELDHGLAQEQDRRVLRPAGDHREEVHEGPCQCVRA
ncbi:hypothetical protein [Nonomuraea sp. NPDC050202]|uniref:hypothetical protein n=1 Tax=Nonomuraea sp. NPDC050202 TaxID=3155035 RepID=UPI0033FC77F0